MRYFILFCAAGCLAGAGEVLAESSADSPDCNAIRTTLIPYQIKLIKEHSVWREFHTIQIARDPSGSEAASIQVATSTPYKRKLVLVNSFPKETNIQYTIRGKSYTGVGHSTFKYDGIDPKQIDFRTGQKFASQEKWEWFDGKNGERSSDVSYTYLKTERVTIGDCIFTAYLGEQNFTDKKTGQTGKLFLWHFPDLRLTVNNSSPDVTFQTISTTFEPIEFEEPNWPPAPSKVDNH